MRRAAHIFSIGALGAALGIGAGVGAGLAVVDAVAKPTPSLKAERVPDTALLIQNLGRGKLTVNGKEWDAKKYCNEQAIANPEQIELYSLNEQSEAVVLCTGSVDGDENVVSVFPKSGWPKSRRVKPTKTKSRISDEVLRNTIIRLTRKD